MYVYITKGFPGGSDSKESACNMENLGSIPGLGRSPGGWHGNPLQGSCLENLRDGRAWRAAVYEVAQSWTRLKQLSRDLFKKIRDANRTFHEKMGTIKDRNGMNLTEAEDIKKRWQEYTEELYKKDLHDPENHDGVITHLEPDILECEVYHYEQS